MREQYIVLFLFFFPPFFFLPNCTDHRVSQKIVDDTPWLRVGIEAEKLEHQAISDRKNRKKIVLIKKSINWQ